MDSQATLRDLLDALRQGDWDAVRQFSDVLLATFICHLAVSRADDVARRRLKGGRDAAS